MGFGLFYRALVFILGVAPVFPMSSPVFGQADEGMSLDQRYGRIKRKAQRRRLSDREEAWRELEELAEELEAEFFDPSRGDILYEAAMALARPRTADIGPSTQLRWLNVAGRVSSLRDRPDALFSAEYRRAQVLQSEGRFQEAVSVLEQALVLTEGRDDRRPYMVVLLADLLSRCGREAEALEWLEILSPSGAGSEVLEASVRRYAGVVRIRVSIRLGLSIEASRLVENQLREALALPESDSTRAAEVQNAHVMELSLLLETEGFEAVRRKVPQYLALDSVYADFPEKRAQLEVYLALALAQTERLDPSQRDSLELLERLLEEEALDKALRFEALRTLADLLLVQGDFEKAEQLLKEAWENLESRSFGAELPVRGEAILASLEVRLALRRGAPKEELIPVHKALQKAYGNQLATWAELPRPVAGIDFLNFDHRLSVPAELIRSTVAIDEGGQGKEEALEILLELQGQATLSRRVGSAPVRLEEIRRDLISPGHGLLLYLPAPYGSHLFAVDGERLVHEELEDRDRILPVQESYLSLLSTPLAELEDPTRARGLAERERELAKELSGLLLPTSIQSLVSEWTAVTVIGSDLIGPIPFEWLPWKGGEFLGVEKRVDYLPSAPLGCFLKKRREERISGYRPLPGLDLLFVGDSVPSEAGKSGGDPTYPRLEIPQEFQGALERLYGDRGEFLLGERASSEALFRSSAQGVRILQLLVHGIRDESRARPVGLLLSSTGRGPEGGFFCGDVEDWVKRAGSPVPECVLLTSCGSGQGPVRRGDPAVADLGGAFLMAGADVVLLASSDLSLHPTLALSRELHRGLSEGRSLSEAMRWVRESLVREDPSLAPFRGGPLRVVGLGDGGTGSSLPEEEVANFEEALESSGASPRETLLWWGLAGVVGLGSGFVLGVGFASRRGRS